MSARQRRGGPNASKPSNKSSGAAHGAQTGAAQRGKNLTSAADAASAKQVILAAAQSSAGALRLTTQTGTTHEVAALASLASSSDVIGAAAANLLLAIGVTSITSASTWSTAVTRIAAS